MFHHLQRFLHIDPLGTFTKREAIAKSLVQARQEQGEREAKMNGGKPLPHKPCTYASISAGTAQPSAGATRWMSKIPENVMRFDPYAGDWRQRMPMSTFLTLRRNDVIYFDFDELLADTKPVSKMWLCEKMWLGVELSERCTACGTACRSWKDLIAVFTGGIRVRVWYTSTLSTLFLTSLALVFILHHAPSSSPSSWVACRPLWQPEPELN